MSLGYDPKRAVKALREADPKLAALIERVGPFRMEVREMYDPYGYLLRSVAYQQLTGKAAATIFGRLVALFPDCSHFPRPEQIVESSDELLRSCGLSRSKVLAIRDIAAKRLDGTIPDLKEVQELPDDELITRLTRIRGVGQWTVEMLLIFRLGRPDILPLDDYGVKKGFARTFITRNGLDRPFRPQDLPKKAQMLRRGEKWKPYRSVASWYLWRAAEL